MVDDKGTSKDLKTWFIHNNSDVSDARARYSASAKDLDSVACFFNAQDTNE